MSKWMRVAVSMLVLLAGSALVAQQPAVYSEDFQSYNAPDNPSGWVDTSVGGSQANGLYKTWRDPQQSDNIVYGTKQSSGKPEGNNPRIGTFSTLTTKTFSANGRFEYRGRFLRTNTASRVGLTFFSSYPQGDAYYLIGLWSVPNSQALTMQLFGFGGGTPAGTRDSGFTPDADKWVHFFIQADDADNATKIRARFWLEGTAEPSTFSIDAIDTSATRLKQGRIGIWSAVKGDAYVDDLDAKSPSDHTGPTIAFSESGTPLPAGALTQFNRDVRVDVQAVDASGIASLAVTLNGNAYVPLTPITAEGTHTINAGAIDGAGNRSESQTRVLIDRTAPLVRVTGVTDGQLVNHAVVPMFTAEDVTAVTTAATLDGAPFASGTSVGAEGAHTLVVTATNSVGLSSSVTVRFTIDLTPPSIAFTSPTNDQRLATAAIITRGTITDAVRVTINNLDAQLNAGTFSFPLTLVEGTNSISAIAYDAAGNTATATIRVQLDTLAPQLTIASPAAHLCTNANELAVRGIARDEGVTVRARIADGAWIRATLANGEYDVTLPLANEGELTLVVEAADSVGHTATAMLPLRVDRTKPVLVVSESGVPMTAGFFNRSVVPLVRIEDADENVNATITLDGAPHAIGTSIDSEQAHVLRVTASDCAGNIADAVELAFTIDRTAPSIAAITPANGATVGAQTRISGTLSEPATVSANGVNATVDALTFSLELPLVEGTNSFELVVTDRAGNETRVPYALRLRSDVPFVELVENGLPFETNAVFDRAVAPTIRVSDASATLVATLDGQPFTSGTSITSEGTHTLVAQATNAFGRVSNEARATFTIDRTAPSVTLTVPGRVDSDSVEVHGTFTEEAASAIVNGISATISGNAFTATIPLDLGANTIAAVVTDRAGNHGRAIAEVTRDGNGPAILLTSPPDELLTNRATVVVAGQVLTPDNATLRINGAIVPLDPAGGFRKLDFPLVEGDNTITAMVTNGAATNELSVHVRADFTSPQLTVTAGSAPLIDGMRFRTAPSIAIHATDERDGVTTRIILDGAEVAAIGALGEGGHVLSVIARDAAGNETRIDRLFFVGDDVANEGCGLTDIDPQSDSAFSGSTIRINGRSGGAASVLINGNAAQVANGSFCGEATLAPGRNEITIRCADASGNATSDAPVTLIVYRDVDPSIVITSPADGATLTNGVVTVSGTVSDGVVSGEIHGLPFTLARGTTTFSVPNVSLAAGLNVITARAKNGAGRTGIGTSRVTLLNAPPQLAITSPIAGTETGASTLDVTGTYTNVDPSTIRVNGAAATITPRTATNGTFRADVSLGITNTITATGRNHAGIAATSSVTVKHIDGAPSLTITAPLDNAIVHDETVHVTGTITSDAGSQVQINGIVATLNGTSFSANVPLIAGTNPILARVTAPDGDDALDAIRVTRFAAPLAVRDTFPANEATNVDRGAAIIVLFNNTLDAAPQLRLTNAAGEDLSGTTYVDRDAITFAPNTPLAAGETYTVSVAALTTFRFTTSSSAPSAPPLIDDVITEGCLAGATITGRASLAGARVRLDLDGITLTTTASDTGAFRFTFTFSGQPGFHLARIREIGSDGSTSPDRAICFRIDCDLPRVTSAALDRESKTLVITFSRAMNPSTLVVGDSIVIDTLTGTLALNATHDVATITFAELPQTDVTLMVKKSVQDAAGASPAADFTQLFTLNDEAGEGRGFVSGAIYDATTGRPLANATINIDGVTLTTNARGRYSRALDEGAYTIGASANGYTHAWRQVIVPAGAGVVPIDIRLTKRGTTTVDGADTTITKRVEVTSGTVTAIGAQSLAGLLPLGWSPLTSAEITQPATLTFFINATDVRNALQTLSLVRYESDRDEWRVEVAAVNVPDDGRVTYNAIRDGHYALVYPDAAPHLAHPPTPRTGAALAGVASPANTDAMTARAFTIEPRAILPNGRAVATLLTDGATQTYPSGSALQATIDEQLNLADGRVLVDAPFATDLLVYRTLAGNAGVADFHLAPSPQAAAVTLRDGIERVRIVDYPGRIARGSLVGAEGGRVPGDGTVTIDIPSGATTDALHAVTSALDPSTFGAIAGFRIAGAFTLALTNASDSSRDASLLVPARATFAISGEAAHEVVIAEVLGDTPFGILYRLVAIADRSGSLYTTRAIDSTQLPLEGLVRGGQYLILAANEPIAFAFGTVRNATNVAIGNARVTSGLGVTALTPLTGVFVVPVPAKPAASFALTARSTLIGDGATKLADAAPDAGAFIDFGALPLVAQPPQLRSVTPDGGEVATSTSLIVRAEFDRAIDASSIANGIRVTNLETTTELAGTISAAGSNVTFVATEPLRAGASYIITIASTIRSFTGTPFGQTITRAFRTAALPAGNTSIHPDRIRITLPDANGRSTIRGTAGALPANAQAVAVRRGKLFVVGYQATVAADGSFSFDAGHGHESDRITTTDRIDLQIIDETSHAVIAIIELTPFASADGRTFLAMPDRETHFTSSDGFRVTVPNGAFDAPTLITVTSGSRDAFADVPSFDTELAYATSVTLQFDGIAKKRLELELPIPTNTDTSRTWLLGWLGTSMRGPRVMITDTLRIDGNAFKTGIASNPNARVLANARVTTNLDVRELRDTLLGATQSGTYAVVNVLSPAGSDMVWGLIDGISGGVDVFWDSLVSLFAARHYVEDRARIAIPLITNKPFRVFGVDAATGLESFSKTYTPIPTGDPGASIGLANPNPDRFGPYPVFGSPFRVESLELAVPDVAYTSIRDFTITLRNGVIYAETTLPATRRVTLMNISRGSVDRNRIDSLYVDGAAGDRIVLLIEELDVDPYASFSIAFSEAIDGSNLPSHVRIEMQEGDDFVQLTNALTLRLDSNDRRVLVDIPASLQRGKRYRVVLDPQLRDKSGVRIGEVRDSDGNTIGTLNEPLYLDFTVREPGGVLGSFDIASGRIRDEALNGNVLLVSAMEGGITAYDVSNPAMPVVAGSTRSPGVEYWSLATDHHGRVFATATEDVWGVLRTFRLEDFLPVIGNTPRTATSRANLFLSWLPGTAASLGINSRSLEDERPEALPRKVQVLVQDDELTYDNRAAFVAATNAAQVDTEGEFEVYRANFARDPQLPYATQRITVENLTLDLHWSADATASEAASIGGILMRAGDRMRVLRNVRTYGVVSLFGYGVGVYDLNAVESNDATVKPPGYVPVREVIRSTNAKKRADCNYAPDAIPDLTFSPDAAIFAQPKADEVNVVAADALRGLLDLAIPKNGTREQCDDRANRGLLLHENPRLAQLRALFVADVGREPFARFNAVAPYRWTISANENTDGQRGTLAGVAASRDYVLIPANEYGLLVVEVNGAPAPLAIPSYKPLYDAHLVEVIWIPHGAYAVRAMSEKNLATVVDGEGHVLLVDLSRIDERWSSDPNALFPTAASTLASGIATPDPRIVWRSAEALASGTLAPVVHPSGFVFAGKLLEKTTNVVAALDPQIRITSLNRDTRLLGVVPAGLESKENLASFRIEVDLPGGIDNAIESGTFTLDIDSERVVGAKTEETPAQWPRAHLRNVAMRRVIPPSRAMLRFQTGFNRWVSDPVIAIADPRAASNYAWPANVDRIAAGCVFCDAHPNIPNEIFSLGRWFRIRPDVSALANTRYAYLAQGRRLETLLQTIPADTVRPPFLRTAAQAPAIADGMLQETTHLHSGELEVSVADFDFGGRAGWNVTFDRTYRSRSIGLSPIGAGWDSSIFRRLRELPSGNVELRDGSGEVWEFVRHSNEPRKYFAPLGLQLLLVKADNGWSLLDPQLRLTSFDALGRLVSESDEFRDGRNVSTGNTIHYGYGPDGRLASITDPVGRRTLLRWDDATGLLRELEDWRSTPRKINLEYDSGRLVRVKLPDVANTDDLRPQLEYGYTTTSTSLNDQLEVATNLETIKDPHAFAQANGAPRVKFEYAGDRVIKQTWATGESATVVYPAPPNATSTVTSVTTHDVLGQERRYTLTSNTPNDALADRAHVVTLREVGVEVYGGAAFGQLPASVVPGAPARNATDRVFDFAFANGMLASSSQQGLGATTIAYRNATSTAGKLVESITTTPSAPSGGGGSSTALPASTSLQRFVRYQQNSDFIRGYETAGKFIESMQPHRENPNPKSTNSSVVEQSSFDAQGRATSMTSTGGTDSSSEGAASSIKYWPDDDALAHRRGLPRVVTQGSGIDVLETSYDYPSATQLKEKAPRGVETTTELDAWDRPIHITTSRLGDPVTLESRFYFDASGRLTRSDEWKDARPITTRYEYDAMGRRTAIETDGIATVGSMRSTTEYKLNQRQIVTTTPGRAFTTARLDKLGRTVETETVNGTATTINGKYAYDLGGNLVYTSDEHTATVSAFDVHGRAIGTRAADGTVTTTEYTEWGQPKRVRSYTSDATELFAETELEYTAAGKLESTSTRTEGDRKRITRYAWDGGGRTTKTATNGRASTTQFDVAGRLRKSAAGAGDLGALNDTFVSTEITPNLDVPGSTRWKEKTGNAYASTREHNLAGNVTRETVGTLEWNRSFDSFGSVTKANEPNRPQTEWTTDARGAVEEEKLPGGATNRYTYDASGAQASYLDPTSEGTITRRDLLGRVTSREYADGTSERIEWEGARVKSTTDRQNRTQTYAYNELTGQLREISSGGVFTDKLEYDGAGRLKSWRTPDTLIEWDRFDYEGRPRLTRQTRYRTGSFGDVEVLDVFEQKHEYNEHGERTRFTMPLPPGNVPSAPWTMWLEQQFDAMGNVIAIHRLDANGANATPLMTATHRAAGRPDVRTIFTPSNTAITRRYAYDDETSQLRRVEVAVGNTIVAGTEVTHDGLQVAEARSLGLASDELATRFAYDDRSRLLASVFGSRTEADPTQPVAGRSLEMLNAADFRTQQERTSASGDDVTTTTFEEQTGHKIAKMMRGPEVRPFIHGGAERIDDGRFVYTYDAKGRLIHAQEKASVPPFRRVTYIYNGANRMVGRRAEYTTASSPRDDDWKLEDRATILAADGYPVDTTFAWDLITDRLLAVYAAGSTSNPLRQIIHGDAAYDDPLITTTIDPSNNTPTTLFPIFDEAAAGALQTVLNANGQIVARNLPNDPYGADDRALTGTVVDRIAINATADNVEITLHVSEELDPSTIAAGSRLAIVDASTGTVLRAPSTTPTLADAFTIRWTLPLASWQSLTADLPTNAALSVAVTSSLRARAWTPTTPILPPPATDDSRIFTSSAIPVELRHPLATLIPPIASTLYELETLALAPTGDREPLFEQLVTAKFQALPFSEPMTGLVYVRERWLAPQSGTFLSPDPLGYTDSANLYAYCGGDPVNCSDPTGKVGESDLAADRRAIAAKRDSAAQRSAHAAEVAEKQRLDALHRAGTRRLIELRRMGIDVKADDIVYYTPDWRYGLTGSGRVVSNPDSGVIEDETADVVLTVTAFKVAAPLITIAFRTGGVRAAAPIVADELAGVALGANPSIVVNAPRAILNALDAQRVLADLTRQVNAELAANPELARAVLSRAEYEAAVRSGWVAAAQYGNAVERLVAARIADDPALSQVFRHIGGPNRPDFIAFGRNFDITTETRAQVMSHMGRRGYGQELIVVTYERPSVFTTFPSYQ